MPRIIVLVIGLLLLIAAGVGGWFAYQAYAPMLFGPKEEKPPPPPPPKVPRFVRLQALTVPVVGASRVEQLITFLITIEVEDEGVANTLQAQMPRIIDAFLVTLYAGLSDGTLMKAGLIDVAAVKVKLMRACTTVLGKDVVHNALVQMVYQRNL